MMASVEQHVNAFQALYQARPALIVRAPGRVNLIGEHTDYNDGFVLPIAIEHAMVITARPHAQGHVRVHSSDYGADVTFDWDDLRRLALPLPWSHYLAGVMHVWAEAGLPRIGLDAVLSGNVPQGAGLSSSAAFEVAVGTLLNALTGVGLNAVDIALMAQKAENDYIGVRCGIMDQFISAMGVEDAALLIDCRDLSHRPIVLQLAKHGLVVAIVHSGVRRGLLESAYNERREQCEQGAALCQAILQRPEIRNLRDIDEATFAKLQAQLPAQVRQRCAHVISENQRVLDSVAAITSGNMHAFGALMNASHRSLSEDFGVSTPELDTLVRLSQAHPGVLGARLTGAGFGGCVVVLLRQDALSTYEQSVLPAYQTQTGCAPQLWVSRATQGAHVLTPDDHWPSATR